MLLLKQVLFIALGLWLVDKTDHCRSRVRCRPRTIGDRSDRDRSRAGHRHPHHASALWRQAVCAACSGCADVLAVLLGPRLWERAEGGGASVSAAARTAARALTP